MAVTLAESALLSQDDLQRGVLETFVQESVVLDRIPFLSIQGNAYAYNAEDTLPGVQFRAVNDGYDESTGTVVQATEKLVILGGDADVDRFIVQTRGNLNDQRAVQTRMKVKAASYFFQDKFINGDTSKGADGEIGFDGLKKRLTGNQVLDFDDVIMDGSDATNAKAYAFFDAMDDLVSRVRGLNGSNGAIYANAAVIAKIRSAGRRIGGVDTVREDMTGKRVVTWNGIPVLDLGQNADGADILPQTEGDDGGESSIYAVKYGSSEGDQAVTGLTNGGVQVYDLGELDSKPVYRTRLEFYTGLATFGGRAAARMTGVRTAPADAPSS